MTVYNLIDQVPLTFQRFRGGSSVSGLTVTVSVKNAQTGAVLLSTTSCPEVSSGSGIYTYLWNHGLVQQTECVVYYVVSGVQYAETILIADTSGGQAV